jgi:hypothetical protein
MAKQRKTPGLAGMGNSAMHAALVGLRTSGAAGTHADKREKRARTRSASKARAIRLDTSFGRV